MPTGYTDAILKGIEFKPFVLRCARAFGACMEMRDDAMDKLPPTKIKAGTYHHNEIKNALERIKTLEVMTESECKQAALDEHKRRLLEYTEAMNEKRKQHKLYNDMLDKVLSWQAPSSDHENLKRFMIEQIEQSIKWDCDLSYCAEELKNIKLATPSEWLKLRLEMAHGDLSYHSERAREDEKQAEDGTRWLQQLWQSLEGSR